MTSKDYILIAAVLAKAYESIEAQSIANAHDMHELIANRLSDAFAADNPNFSSRRFLHACDVSGY